jgi:hypothetical protein
MDAAPPLQRAYRFVRVFTVAATLAAAWVWIAPSVAPRAALPVGIGLATAALVCALAAVAVSASLLRRKAGFDVDYLVAGLWLPAMFGLVFPPMQIVALIIGVLRIRRDKVGGYSTVKEGSSTYYPVRDVSTGEAKPYGYTMVAIGTVWTAVLIGLARELLR